MKEDLLKIINHYGVMPQLKYFQSEVFELNEAIIEKEHIDNGELHEIGVSKEYYHGHVCEEIADVIVTATNENEILRKRLKEQNERFRGELETLEKIKNIIIEKYNLEETDDW